MAIGEEQFHSAGEEHALLHRETLFVIATSDAEDVAFKFVAERVSGDLLGYLLVIEDAAEELME